MILKIRLSMITSTFNHYQATSSVKTRRLRNILGNISKVWIQLTVHSVLFLACSILLVSVGLLSYS